MVSSIESVLYLDRQREAPACFCHRCGGQRYAPGLLCLRCERRSL